MGALSAVGFRVGWLMGCLTRIRVVDDAKVPMQPAFGVATGAFPVKEAAGRTVRFGAWIKTQNVTRGYAGLWRRVDGPQRGGAMSFEDSSARIIDGKRVSVDGAARGETGTSDWAWHEIELPVPAEARNINFGLPAGWKRECVVRCRQNRDQRRAVLKFRVRFRF